MNIIKSLFILIAIVLISNEGHGQDYKKSLVASTRIALVTLIPSGLATECDGIPIYLVELRVKGKVFDVHPAPAAITLLNKAYIYNLKDLFRYTNIPKSLFTDSEIVELISKCNWQLDEDVLKVGITNTRYFRPFDEVNRLPSYVQYQKAVILLKEFV